MAARDLLKVTESDTFNAHLAVSFLKTYSNSIGVTYYLVNKLAQFPEEEVEFYWPQLCHLLITRPSESSALEGFIVKKCEESVHLAMLTLWQLQASLSDLSRSSSTPQFAICRRVYNRIQHIIFSDPVIEGSASAFSDRQRIHNQLIQPTIAGIGVLLAALGMPRLAAFSGQTALEQAKGTQQTPGVSYSNQLSSENHGVDNSESEDEQPRGKPTVSRPRRLSQRQSHRASSASAVNKTHSPSAMPKASTSSSTSSVPRSGTNRGNKPVGSTSSMPSYLPGPPIISSTDTYAHSPRTPFLSSSSRRKHLLKGEQAKLGQSQSMVNLPSPTAATFGETDPFSPKSATSSTATSPGPNTSEKDTSPKVTFQSPTRSNSDSNSSNHKPYGPPSLASSHLDIRHNANPHRNARSVPSFHHSASASTLHLSRSTSSLPQYTLPREILTAMLRSYSCRSQLDLLTSLQDIATRLIVVPKMARLSALRAELTVLNHGLPRGCCLLLGCSGKGGASMVSGEATSNSITRTYPSIYSSRSSVEQHTHHHRIVRISPSESVVLNSADRAPFLIHVEVLDGDLDFDPSRRQNAEDIRSVMSEREGTHKVRTTSADGHHPEKNVSQYPNPDSVQTSLEPDNRVGHLSPKEPLSRTPSIRSEKQRVTGVSEIEGNLATDGVDTAQGQEEEVDMVEQVYGSLSIHDVHSIETPEYHPQIHNRSVDEAAWQRAEARKSWHLSPSAVSPRLRQSSTSTSMSLPTSGAKAKADMKIPRRTLTIDEYAERMRMAAIMLSQLSASQQLPRSSTDAVTGVVGAGVGLGVNLTYGVGSMVGSVVGVGMDAVRAGLGGLAASVPVSATPLDLSQTPSVGQAGSGNVTSIDPTSAASGLSTVSGSLNPAMLPEQLSRVAAISPTTATTAGAPHARQRVLPPQEAAAIRERIMSEMMALEEERMARMRAASASAARNSNGSLPAVTGAAHGHPETTEEESVVMRAVNKEDPSGAVFQESWSEKKTRIRKASPYGHLVNWDVFSVIVKTGADLRQEQLAVQLIKEFGRIWSETKCPHWVRYFRILVTGESTGLMETITDAISVHSIKKEAYSKLAAAASEHSTSNGYLPSFTLYDHFLQAFGDPNTSKYRKAQDAFMKSLASYSIISYLLQIKDRHNGNILLDKQGHVMHIDFGFMLSNSPGSLGFEMAPFKLTQDYIDILGGMDSPKFSEYRTLMKRQFRDVRRHAERVVAMVELMQTESKLPCFNSGEATSQNLRDRFQLGLKNDEKAVDDYIDRLIVSSAGSAFTRLYDTFQRHSQGVL